MTKVDSGRVLASLREQVRLASGEDFAALLKMLDAHKSALATLENAAATTAAAAYREAGHRITAYVSQIVANNPTKTLAEIVGRADVQAVILESLTKAETRSISAIRQGYRSGFTSGRLHAKQELALIGQPHPSVKMPEHSPYLEQLITDLKKSTTTSSGAVLQAAQAAHAGVDLPEGGINPRAEQAALRALYMERAIDKESRKLANRATAGASSGSNRAYTEAQLDSYKASMEKSGKILKKVWVTNFGAHTCPECAALHGTVLGVSEVFDATQSFGAAPPPVYQTLSGPPRHPRCRCRTSVYIDEFNDGKIKTSEKMRADGRRFAEHAKAQAPRSWGRGPVSSMAKNTNFLESGDIRNASDAKYEGAVRAFRACMTGE